MKMIFLLLTILIGTNVLADCCNFEVDTSTEHHEMAEASDHCDDTKDNHQSSEDCHCTPNCSVRLAPVVLDLIQEPVSLPLGEDFTPLSNLYTSSYEPFIFHPPIA